MAEPVWQLVTREVTRACQQRGIDLVHPFALAWYNRAVDAKLQLGDFGRPRALALLLANTKALWPSFEAALRCDAALARTEHPLDTYVEASVGAAAELCLPHAQQAYFGHAAQPAPLPIQRLAELVGFAALAPSHLAVHPLHGPWVALRAVLVIDVQGPSGEPPELPRPCPGCAKPCMPAFERALEASGIPLASRAIARNAEAWIAVRDACPIGAASRYGQPQLDYHYRGLRPTLQGS